jgi:hypothetical protein
MRLRAKPDVSNEWRFLRLHAEQYEKKKEAGRLRNQTSSGAQPEGKSSSPAT